MDQQELNAAAPTPRSWRLTAFQRTLIDFENFLAGQGQPYFSADATIDGLLSERRRISRRADWLLLISFVGAAVVVAGGFPKDAKITLLGVEGPASMVSLQLLAVLVSGLFLRFMQTLVSLNLLGQMLERIMKNVPYSGPEFLVARYDATYLWTNLFRLRDTGYVSPRTHKIGPMLFNITGLIMLMAHVGVVGVAMWIALRSSFVSVGAWSVPFAFAVLASLMAAVGLILFIIGYFVPIRFRMSEDMEKHLREQGKTIAD